MRSTLDKILDDLMATTGHTKVIFIGLDESTNGQTKGMEVSCIGTTDAERIALLEIARTQMVLAALGKM